MRNFLARCGAVAVTSAVAAIGGVSGPTDAGFIIEIDTDGMDDGPVAYNPGFNFGGDTTTAASSVTVTTWGTTGGDSIFGGDGINQPDTYVYAYSPDSQADNLFIPAGQDLGDGNLGTGVTGGGHGQYRVYVTWPYTENVGSTSVSFDVIAPGDNFIVNIDQNFKGNEWYLLGTINYTGGIITVTQRAEINSFVSMRAYGVMFELVPAPSALALLGVAGLIGTRRRRSA